MQKDYSVPPDWQDGTDEGSRSEVRGFRNVELRIAPFSQVTRLTRHALWSWRLFQHPGRVQFFFL